MNNNEFLKELNKELRYLNKDARQNEIEKYSNLNNSNLNPHEIAQSIYNSYNIKIFEKETLFNSVNIIINKLQSKNQKIIINIIKFFLYLLVLLIVIKIPFIYIRDLLGTFFESLLYTSKAITLWYLSYELLYAITTILIFIRLIKKKAIELKNIE